MCSREVRLLIDPSFGCFLVEWSALSCALDVVVCVVETGLGVRFPIGVEGLPKVCCRRTSRVGHEGSQCSTVCGAFTRSEHEESTTRSSKWVLALSNSVWRAGRTRSARFFWVALQSAFQETF